MTAAFIPAFPKAGPFLTVLAQHSQGGPAAKPHVRRQGPKPNPWGDGGGLAHVES